ncbi:MAG: hypothetical protein ACKO7W_21170 [Elainella sp.]
MNADVAIAINRTGNTVNDAIGTPAGSVAIQFADGTNITQVHGTAALNVAGFAAVNGSIFVEKTPNALQVGITAKYWTKDVELGEARFDGLPSST